MEEREFPLPVNVSKEETMGDDKRHPEQDPAEGSRETVERELKKTSESGHGQSVKKAEIPADGPRGGKTHTQKPETQTER
jgi:hypothetical protein